MAQKELKISILFLSLVIAVVLLMGMTLFSWVEGWSLIDAFYFVTMTATTVGYGDLVPTHTLSKIMTILYSLSIVPLVLYVFSLIAKYETEKVYRKVHHLEHKQQVQEEEIEKAERKLTVQKHEIKEQEADLEKQERKLREQARINKAQEADIQVHDAELEVVEEIVEDVLAKKSKKSRLRKKK
jgi:hypothetical protein